MVKLNKIYTRTGDGGETGLVDGSRAPKHDPRIAAMGEVDEANSAIGVALRGDFSQAFVEQIKHTYLFDDGDAGLVFMNPNTYDQVHLSRDMVGDSVAYLQPEMVVDLTLGGLKRAADQ